MTDYEEYMKRYNRTQLRAACSKLNIKQFAPEKEKETLIGRLLKWDEENMPRSFTDYIPPKTSEKGKEKKQGSEKHDGDVDEEEDQAAEQDEDGNVQVHSSHSSKRGKVTNPRVQEALSDAATTEKSQKKRKRNENPSTEPKKRGKTAPSHARQGNPEDEDIDVDGQPGTLPAHPFANDKLAQDVTAAGSPRKTKDLSVSRGTVKQTHTTIAAPPPLSTQKNSETRGTHRIIQFPSRPSERTDRLLPESLLNGRERVERRKRMEQRE
jgi:hypothetical protein